MKRSLALVAVLGLASPSPGDSQPALAAVEPSCAQSAAIACGESIVASIDGSECALGGGTFADFYRVEALLGQVLTIDMTSEEIDSRLALLDPTLDTRAFDDEGGSGADARLEYVVADVPGSWTIAAHNTAGNDLGAYTLSLDCDQLDPSACLPSADTLCLDDQPDDHRFRVDVEFATSQSGGRSGFGRALSLADQGVTRGGLFWFFSGDNPELLVKVLDGCALNGHYWVFYSATTNVGLHLVVTDTRTGRIFTRSHPDLTPVAPVQEVRALACE